mgnify:CR=1 FL=1
MSYYGFSEYVPVAKRKENAKKLIKKLEKKGQKLNPISIEGRVIAKSFWGNGWCTHLETMNDFESRLPRGRTYARNGSVIDLNIKPGLISATVSGSEIYKIQIKIKTMDQQAYKKIITKCRGEISSLIDLLSGKFSKGIMTIVADEKTGLFPKKSEISFGCDCYDYADMCKHVAAVLYGVGHRLDHHPEELFLLRGVDHTDLIHADSKLDLNAKDHNEEIQEDLGNLFDIDIADSV